ncbi:MAG: DUF4127 family protein [Acidaminococcaceae bacterium]|jgi:hypothetical protein|nr:DUF4127 family protein [Acidaminococcaceae bacterium]
MKKLVSIGLTSILIVTGVFYHTIRPRGSTFSPVPLKTDYLLATLPLDSRPPCSDFTSQMGALAGMKVQLPPLWLMDHNLVPAQKDLLKIWLSDILPQADGAIIATDLLSYGGLLHTRVKPLTPWQENNFLDYLTDLRIANPTQYFYVYSIIPRLLVSDQIIPDAWYQWHLMQWATSMDKKLEGLPYDKKQYEELQGEIPMDIKWKYLQLYKFNNDFNEKLAQTAEENSFNQLVIGQDDAQSFGLPNHNRLAIEKLLSSLPGKNNYHVTQGADELGMLAVAKIFSQKNNYIPKIFVAYSTPQVQNMVLHFVPGPLSQLVADKINLLGGIQTGKPENADFILFIHCGNENTQDFSTIGTNVKKLMTIKPVAVVDLSLNYDAKECILPQLIADKVPLPQLISYAGWNSASNSIGTALAQSVIVTGQRAILPQKELPYLYAQNLKFTCARFLDDWAYQRKVRSKVGEFQEINGINADNTLPYTELVENYINRELAFYKNFLLFSNLRRFPFYQDNTGAYYLQDLNYKATLPWDRFFEIRLKVFPTFGKVNLTN